jgi:hypothetical protein
MKISESVIIGLVVFVLVALVFLFLFKYIQLTQKYDDNVI